ncbi:MAG TPA: thioredoxin fold domain-containing protein [Bacteroidota bacterium]|nr:thioredoxin fold domain-containing protein [Bacteroidota bacterium]
MKYLVVALILSAALMNGVLSAQSRQSAMHWNSFDAGMEEAKASHKKVLVDIYTDWCGWCKKMDSDVYTDPGVKDYLFKNYVIIKMNAEGSGKVHYKGQEYSPAQLAAAFGVNGYPSTLFMRDNAEPITLLPGYAEAPMFLLVLSFIAEDQYQKKQFSDYLKEKGVKE